MVLLGGLIDYDGVIAKTKERQFLWFREWARQNRVPFPYAHEEEFSPVYNKVIGEQGVQKVYDHFSLPCDMNDFSHPVWPAYELFKQHNPVEMYEGIGDALTAVWNMGRLNSDLSRNRSLRMAINTTNSWKSIHPDLVRFGINHLFDAYCTAEVLNAYVGDGGSAKGVHKPSKVSVALLLNILDTEGEMTFHLGDTISDLRASCDVRAYPSIRGQNLITIGAAWGFDGRAALEKGYTNGNGTVHFSHIIDHPSELPGVIKQYL
jgi:phosphoglycolate phosphatase-like HAD superfamily hydrolase